MKNKIKDIEIEGLNLSMTVKEMKMFYKRQMMEMVSGCTRKEFENLLDQYSKIWFIDYIGIQRTEEVSNKIISIRIREKKAIE